MPLSSSRALVKASKTAPLPSWSVLKPLYDQGCIIRAGQLVVVFGQPGAGKSTFVTRYIKEIDVPALIFSADMDAMDAISREGSMRSGWTVDDVVSAINNGSAEYFSELLLSSNIQWCFNSSPTLMDIADELSAYVEMYDEYPKVIVVDNAMNVEGETEDEQGGLKLVFKELHRLAHETGICVVLLHHAREESDPGFPPARAQLQGKVGQLPEIILGVALDQNTETFRIAAVKVRSGKSDASGKTFIELYADPSRAAFHPIHMRATVEYQGKTW